MEDMHKRLADCAVASSPPTVDEVHEGTCWIGLFCSNERWYRVRALKDAKKDDSRDKVLFVDFGNSTLAPVSNLRPLPTHLAVLPACAHRMALAFVAPKGDKWDREAIDLFVLNTGFETVLHVGRKGQFHLGHETVTEGGPVDERKLQANGEPEPVAAGAEIGQAQV